MRRRISAPSMRASCCDGSAAHGEAAGAALVGVPDHRLGVVGADQDEVEATEPGGHRGQLDVAGLAHRAGVEGRDLVVVGVGRAQETRRVPKVRDVDRCRVDPVTIEPGAVVVEVAPDGADQRRAQAERAHGEADVGRHPAAADVEVLDEEGQRDLVEAVRDQRGREQPRDRSSGGRSR